MDVLVCGYGLCGHGAAVSRQLHRAGCAAAVCVATRSPNMDASCSLLAPYRSGHCKNMQPAWEAAGKELKVRTCRMLACRMLHMLPSPLLLLLLLLLQRRQRRPQGGGLPAVGTATAVGIPSRLPKCAARTRHSTPHPSLVGFFVNAEAGR